MCNFHKKRDTYSSFKRLAGEVCPVENNEKLPNDFSLRDRSFLMGEGWGAGGIRRVTPVVYDDPPSSWEVFLAHPHQCVPNL